MVIKQVSVFVENKAGTLAEISRVLADSGLNLRALSLADTRDYGVLRLIVNDPVKADETLRNAGFTVTLTEVVALSVDDRPGALSEALAVIAEKNIAVEYMYAFIGKKENNAVVVMKIGDDSRRAASALTDAGYKVLCGSEIYN